VLDLSITLAGDSLDVRGDFDLDSPEFLSLLHTFLRLRGTPDPAVVQQALDALAAKLDAKQAQVKAAIAGATLPAHDRSSSS
jgi:hypothetical protein